MKAKRNHRFDWVAASLAIALIALSSGCGRSANPAPKTEAQQTVTREIWEVSTLGGRRVGYGQTTFFDTTHDGQPAVRIESRVRMTLHREGTAATIELRSWSLETPGGEVLQFNSTAPAMQFQGEIRDGKLHLVTASTGHAEQSTLAWSAECRGFCGVQQSLWAAPLQAGERRTLSCLEPTLGQPVAVELAAKEPRETALLAGSKKLLPIVMTAQVDGRPMLAMNETLWIDESGDILKRRSELMNVEVFRATRDEALAETPRVGPDLLLDIAVPVSRVLEHPHQTRQVRYRLELDGTNPAQLFVGGGTQEVRPIDATHAEVTVRAARPGQPLLAGVTETPPTEADRRPSNLIQSDDPAILAAAEKAAEGRTAPAEVAVALEKFVHGAIRDKSYTQAFDSAVDVLRSGRGDCTEHAVLLAALCRARGIPARVAMGLVYRDQKFLYHLWTEAFFDGRWVPLDATLAQGGIGAAHLKIAHSSLESRSAYVSLLPVVQVAGKLKIEILEAE